MNDDDTDNDKSKLQNQKRTTTKTNGFVRKRNFKSGKIRMDKRKREQKSDKITLRTIHVLLCSMLVVL